MKHYTRRFEDCIQGQVVTFMQEGIYIWAFQASEKVQIIGIQKGPVQTHIDLYFMWEYVSGIRIQIRSECLRSNAP